MKRFIKYFPVVYSYACGAFTLYAFFDWVHDHKHNVLRRNPDLLVSVILGVLIMLVSWVWLFGDYNREDED